MNSIHDLNKVAKKFFSLTLPTSRDELKQAYRREAARLHPDKGGSHNAFVKMKRAYEILSSAEFIFQEVSTPEFTLDTNTLGKGLPFSGGILCESCKGSGYFSVQINLIKCPICKGNGHIARCRKCSATGRIGSGIKCPACNGFGQFAIRSAALSAVYMVETCLTCSGSGGFRPTKPVIKHSICKACGGIGEIWSPVEWLRHKLLGA